MKKMAITASRVGRSVHWLGAGARLLRGELRRRWYLFGILVLIWVLASMRLFVHHAPVVPVLVNWTPSVPYSIVYVPIGRGLLQPYERIRQGELAGSTGSRTPAFPVRASAPRSRESTT